MERTNRVDPATGQSVEIVLDDTVDCGSRWDDYRVVDLFFADGRHYQTIVWRAPQERGRHWWYEPGMVIVHDLTTELILAAVDDFLRQRAIDLAFERIGGSEVSG